MTTQLGLFDRPPAFPHATETARPAAEVLTPIAGHYREQVLQFIRARGEEGATDEAVQQALGLKRDTVRARRVELPDEGLILDSHRTRPVRSGRRAVVWLAII